MTIATTAGTATSGCAYRTTRGARVTFKGPGATPGQFVLENEHGARFDVDGGFLLLPDATQPAIVSAVLADWGAEDAPPLADLTAQELAGVVQDAEDISLIEAIQAELKRREKPTAPEEEDPTGVDCPVCTTTTTVRGSELYDVPVLSRHKGPGSPVLCRGGEVPLMEAQRMAYAAKLDAMHPRDPVPVLPVPTLTHDELRAMVDGDTDTTPTATDLPPPTPEQAAIERRATVAELHGSVRGSRVAIRGCEDPALIAEAIAAETEGKNRETILGQLQRRLDKLNGVKRPRKPRKAPKVPTSDTKETPTPTSSSGLPPEDLTEVTSAAPPAGSVETEDGFIVPSESHVERLALRLALRWTDGLSKANGASLVALVATARPSWTPTEIAWEVCCLEGVETSEVGEAAGDAFIRDREINDDMAAPNSEDQNEAALAGYATGYDGKPLIRTSATSQRLRTGWLLAYEAGKSDREVVAESPEVYVSEAPEPAHDFGWLTPLVEADLEYTREIVSSFTDGAVLDGYHEITAFDSPDDHDTRETMRRIANLLKREAETRALSLFGRDGSPIHGVDLEAPLPVAAALSPAPGVSVHGVPGRTVEETTVETKVEVTPVAAFGVRLEKLLCEQPHAKIEVLPAPDPAAAAGEALAALARALPGLAALGIAVEITISTRGN